MMFLICAGAKVVLWTILFVKGSSFCFDFAWLQIRMELKMMSSSFDRMRVGLVERCVTVFLLLLGCVESVQEGETFRSLGDFCGAMCHCPEVTSSVALNLYRNVKCFFLWVLVLSIQLCA